MSHLECGHVGGGAGGVEGDVRHVAALAHHQHLHGLGHLPPSQHRRVHQLPPLWKQYLRIFEQNCKNILLYSVISRKLWLQLNSYQFGKF